MNEHNHVVTLPAGEYLFLLSRAGLPPRDELKSEDYSRLMVSTSKDDELPEIVVE